MPSGSGRSLSFYHKKLSHSHHSANALNIIHHHQFVSFYEIKGPLYFLTLDVYVRGRLDLVFVFYNCEVCRRVLDSVLNTRDTKSFYFELSTINLIVPVT
jgi:hypothetical protein